MQRWITIFLRVVQSLFQLGYWKKVLTMEFPAVHSAAHELLYPHTKPATVSPNKNVMRVCLQSSPPSLWHLCEENTLSNCSPPLCWERTGSTARQSINFFPFISSCHRCPHLGNGRLLDFFKISVLKGKTFEKEIYELCQYAMNYCPSAKIC